MEVIIDRIEGEYAVVELGEKMYDLPLALCPEAKEGDTVTITVIVKQSPQEEPHAIFERLRKNSRPRNIPASKQRRKREDTPAAHKALSESESTDDSADS